MTSYVGELWAQGRWLNGDSSCLLQCKVDDGTRKTSVSDGV